MTQAVLSTHHFMRISELVYRMCGLKLEAGKEELVKSRLLKRLRVLSLGGFDEYLAVLDDGRNQEELVTLLDLLTTNKTSFFREAEHFAYLTRTVLPPLLSRRHLRLWSAGCSTGAEPYTLAMHLLESVPEFAAWDAKVLATDISTRVLDQAKTARYDQTELQDVAPALLSRYFTCVDTGKPRVYEVNAAVRRFISFARLNLMEEWPMRGPFDAIFCRNVMIYFDKQTQERLVERYRQLLTPDGYLFVGHSESLTGVAHRYRYVAPAVYRNAG